MIVFLPHFILRLWKSLPSHMLTSLKKVSLWPGPPQGLVYSKLLNLTVIDYMGRPHQDYEPPPPTPPLFFKPVKHGVKD